MTSFRSTRLEALFGARIDENLPYAALERLKSNQVTEATDLDYKAEHYKNGESEKRDLCGDIAAMANSVGGLILLGITEEKRTSAAEDLVKIALGDDQIRRIRSIAAGGTTPLPSFEVYPVADPADPGNGVIVIAVPQSPMRPHAVVVNNGYRWPVRNGTSTLYLTEAQLADAYRQRARRLDEGAAALERLERRILANVSGPDLVYVATTLVPDVPGYFQLNADRFGRFQNELVGSPGILDHGQVWMRSGVERGRLVGSGSGSGSEIVLHYVGCELNLDGSGSFVTAVAEYGQPLTQSGPKDRAYILDELLVDAIWSGVRLLARHARDRAAVGGNAAVRVTVANGGRGFPLALFHVRHRGFPDTFGITTRVPPVAEGVFDIADLAEDGPPLVAATHHLASEIFQGFGRPEAVQMTPEGLLRRPYWSGRYRQALDAWAAAAGIEFTDETVDAG